MLHEAVPGSGPGAEAGDLCRSLRQCWGLSCAWQPGPSPVQGWICSLKLTGPSLHLWVCAICGFLGTGCHGKLPVPLIPRQDSKGTIVCQSELPWTGKNHPSGSTKLSSCSQLCKNRTGLTLGPELFLHLLKVPWLGGL